MCSSRARCRRQLSATRGLGRWSGPSCSALPKQPALRQRQPAQADNVTSLSAATTPVWLCFGPGAASRSDRRTEFAPITNSCAWFTPRTATLLHCTRSRATLAAHTPLIRRSTTHSQPRHTPDACHPALGIAYRRVTACAISDQSTSGSSERCGGGGGREVHASVRWGTPGQHTRLLVRGRLTLGGGHSRRPCGDVAAADHNAPPPPAPGPRPRPRCRPSR